MAHNLIAIFTVTAGDRPLDLTGARFEVWTNKEETGKLVDQPFRVSSMSIEQMEKHGDIEGLKDGVLEPHRNILLTLEVNPA